MFWFWSNGRMMMMVTLLQFSYFLTSVLGYKYYILRTCLPSLQQCTKEINRRPRQLTRERVKNSTLEYSCTPCITVYLTFSTLTKPPFWDLCTSSSLYLFYCSSVCTIFAVIFPNRSGRRVFFLILGWGKHFLIYLSLPHWLIDHRLVQSSEAQRIVIEGQIEIRRNKKKQIK